MSNIENTQIIDHINEGEHVFMAVCIALSYCKHSI